MVEAVTAFLEHGRSAGLRSLDVEFVPIQDDTPIADGDVAWDTPEATASNFRRLHGAAARLRDAVAGHRTLAHLSIMLGCLLAGFPWAGPPPEFMRAVLDALRAPFCPLRTLRMRVADVWLPSSQRDAVRRAYLVDATDESLVTEAEVDMRARLGARLAFGLAFHPRCGSASPAHVLHKDLVGAILELVPAHAGVGVQTPYFHAGREQAF